MFAEPAAPSAHDQPSTSDDMVESFRRGGTGGVGVWQFVVAVIAGVAPSGLPDFVQVATHGSAALIAAAAYRWHRLGPWAFGFAYVVSAVDLAVVESIATPVGFAALFTITIVGATPVLSLRRPHGLAMPPICLVCSLVGLSFRDEPQSLMLAVSSSVICLAIGAAMILAVSKRFADSADAEAAALAEARRRDLASQVAARDSAEQARVVHDTVINTMSAIASGGPATQAAELVRERCARDVRAAQSVLDGVHDPAALRLGQVSALRLPLVRRGLDDEALASLGDHMDDRRAAALASMIGELVTNADKHSRGTQIELEAFEKAGELTVVVRDNGVGFEFCRRPRDRGLERSVLGPAEENGWQVTVDSRAGDGCVATVSGRVQAAAPDQPAATEGPQVPIDSVKRVMCLVWWSTMTVATVVMDAILSGLTPWSPHIGTLLIALAGIGAWADSRSRGQMSLPMSWLVVAAVPVVFWLRLSPLTGEEIHPEWWLIYPMSSLFLGLVVLAPSRAPVYGGFVMFGVATAAAIDTIADGPGLVAVLLIGAAGQLAMVFAWVIVLRAVDGTAAVAERQRRQTAEFRNATAVREAMTRVRERWTIAMLPEVIELLEGVASGRVAPDDPALRRSCAGQEHHLRQVVSLHPEHVLLNTPFARALTEAHRRSIALTIRSGGHDAPDSEVADIVGATLLDAVHATADHAELTAGWFVQDGAHRLLIVGDVTIAELQVADGQRWSVRPRRWSDQGLLELVLVEPGSRLNRFIPAPVHAMQ